MTNALIDINPGGQLKIENDGILVRRTGCNFVVPIGALVEINHGKICDSHDFQ